jgi:large subunit ribosomal protein L18e
MSGESDMKIISKTDPTLLILIQELKRESREGDVAIWRDIARRLEKPRRNWAEVNISRLERYANDGDTIVVPGKVLGAGSLSKKLTVAAYRFSDSAKEMIENAGGRNITIKELVEENPSGTGVRIMG